MGEDIAKIAAQSWDEGGSHLSAVKKIIRANHRGTGCRLTAEEVQSLDFEQGDNDWYNRVKSSLYPRQHLLEKSA